jgi:hypothetical protein
MSELAPAAAAAMMRDPYALGNYMGRDVSSTSVKITKAGDGLSKQLDIEPKVLVPGETYMVLLEAKAGSHTHKVIEKAGTWELIQVLEAQTVTFVDGEDMEKMLRIAADRVQAATEAAKGVQRLDGTDAADLEGSTMYAPDDDGPAALTAGQPEPEWDDD